ncbi:MAG TPA: penicillin-insensitive murein endopeptidase [Stellaceae bacterium]|nr:penicillin-insensitive murein endopeptidase [Stellaceae bacterium]
MRRSALAGTLMLAALAPGAASASFWSDVTSPTPPPAHVIGSPANGCLAGAAALPLDGPGYQVVRVSRHRFFGHPETVRFIERLGRSARAASMPVFYVGDMAQPRGGPMPDSHAAHQNGVDVDVWFTLDPKPALPPLARENVDLPSMLLADRSAVDPTRFGERQVRLLRLAATDPQVDRIFVHPLIKRALCRGEFGAGTGDRSWLRRLRPWYGHDDHFHVRLVCPPGSPDCRQQPPVPPGEGCDAAVFEWWAVELAKPKAPPPLPHAPPPLPAACHALETPE